MENGEYSVRVATLLVSVLLIAFGGLATPVAAQSVDNIQTSLSDTDGDGLDDQVQVDVTVSEVGSGQTTIELTETNFDVDVSPTDTEDGNQAQFVTPMDPDGDGVNERVEFVGVAPPEGISATYTVVADLSNQADGDTGDVDVTLGDDTTDSATYTVGSRSGDTSEDGDGTSEDGGGENDEQDGQDSDTSSDGGDGSDDDDTDTDTDSTGGSSPDDGTDDGSGGEGMPGFTVTVALTALVLTTVMYHRK